MLRCLKHLIWIILILSCLCETCYHSLLQLFLPCWWMHLYCCRRCSLNSTAMLLLVGDFGRHWHIAIEPVVWISAWWVHSSNWWGCRVLWVWRLLQRDGSCACCILWAQSWTACWALLSQGVWFLNRWWVLHCGVFRRVSFFNSNWSC